MNAHAKFSRIASLFRSNRSQAVRIPKDFEFPEGVKKVIFRRQGKALLIVPESGFWDDFFAPGPNPDSPERSPQGEYEERESFDSLKQCWMQIFASGFCGSGLRRSVTAFARKPRRWQFRQLCCTSSFMARSGLRDRSISAIW